MRAISAADPHAGLKRALAQLGSAEILASRSRSWASATFTGARHHFSLRLAQEADVEHWRASLAQHDFHVPGHIVADIVLAAHEEAAADHLVEVEALTVEDA